MPERRNLTRPVVRCGTGFHPDLARVQLAKKVEHGTSPHLLPQDNHPIRIDPVKLKNGLGEINPECCDSHVGGSFPLLVLNSAIMAHCDAVRMERSTHHQTNSNL